MRCLTETRSGRYVVNEDRLLCEAEHSFFAILDGEVHEGHAAIVALEVLRDALPTISDVLHRTPESVTDAISSVVTVVKLANQTIFQDAMTNPKWRGAGTTLTCMGISQSHIVVGHVGDSRAYARDGSGWRCLTHDHTLVAEARRLNHPDLAELVASHSNVITQVVGMAPDIRVEIQQVSKSGISDLLLCTDGFWRPLDPEISYTPLPNITGQELLDAAFVAFEKDGERDNASCVLVSL